MIKFKQILSLLLIIAFIFVATQDVQTTDKSALEVSIDIIDIIGVDDTALQTNNEFKQEFSLNVSDFDSVVYYSYDDVMTVDELLIVTTNRGEMFVKGLRNN